MKISVIVPIYNQWDKVENLLLALEKQTLDKSFYSLFLIDNGSDSKKQINELGEYTFEYEEHECRALGSYAARNFGVEKSDGDILVFTDADCIPDIDWLSEIYHFFQCKSHSLLAGAVRISNNSNKPNSSEIYDSIFGLPQEKYVKNGWAITANLSFPKRCFDEVGGFNQKRLSGGDNEFCIKARKAGWCLEYLKAAEVCHPARSSVGELVKKVRRVKGGQVKGSPLFIKLKYIPVTFLFPVRRVVRVFFENNISIAAKVKLIGLICFLYAVSIKELFLLLFGSKPERQ